MIAMALTRLLIFLFLGSLFLSAATDQVSTVPADVRARMKANLPAIDKLKEAGKIGENRRAYLEARAELTPAEKRLIKTENEDRRTVYRLLADRARATLESVETARAAQIRERSAPGLWLQDPDGRWYRKPPSRSPQPADSQTRHRH